MKRKTTKRTKQHARVTVFADTANLVIQVDIEIRVGDTPLVLVASEISHLKQQAVRQIAEAVTRLPYIDVGIENMTVSLV